MTRHLARASAALALVSTLSAQSTDKPKEDEASVTLDTVTVTSYSSSLAVSLEAKRGASATVDVITAQDVGKFPDTNVAESLSHVAGVTVDRTFGQGERVSILGTDPNLNRTLLNGQTVASGDWFILDAPSRQFNYTLLAPEVIGKAEVYRTPEARLPEGSVGGTILLSTLDPLELKPFVFRGSVSDMYNDRDRKHDGNFSALVSARSKDKKFGILVGIQNSREHIRRDGVEALGTVTAGAAAPNTGIDPSAPSTSLNITNPTAVLPNAINAAYFKQLRERIGGNAVVSFRPTENLDIVANVLNVKLNDNNFNSSFYVFPGWWRGAVVASGTVKDGVVDSGTVNQNIGVMDIFYREATIKTEAYDVKATYHKDNYKVSFQAGYTKATGGTQRQYYIEPLLSSTTSGVGTTSYTFTGGKDNPSFSFADSSVANNPAAWTVGGPWWNGNVAADPESDSEKYGQVDAEIPISKGALQKVQVGGRYSKHSTEQNWYNISLVTLPFYTLNDFKPTTTPSNYLSGLPNISSDMAHHVIVDPVVLGDTVEKASGGEAALAAGQGFQPSQSFAVDEKVYAAYAQTTFAIGQIKGNAGVRYVDTSTDSTGYLIQGSTLTKQTIKKSYSNFLPSANFSYDATKDLVVRLGVSQVISRPNYADLSSSVTLYDSIRQGNGGNPNLKPYKSNNADLSAEWYFTKDSILSGAIFVRDISDYILSSTVAEDHFNENQGKVTTYNISRPLNAGSATQKGFLLMYQQKLPYGFGFSGNYTYLDSSTESNRSLPYASKNQINLSPYWEGSGFLFRLTYAYRSDYLTGVNRGNDVFTAAYREVDFNASYDFTKNLSLTFAATNLLDETYYSYAKVPAKMFQAEYKNGRRFQAGIRLAF